MQVSSATTATAPAAIATIPAVLFRLCTAGRIRTPPPGKRPARGTRPGDAAAQAAVYWKVTGNVSVLFAVFFSPGTFAIVAVTV